MGGFLGDIAKPIGQMLTFGQDVLPRPDTSAELTAAKHKAIAEEQEKRRQVLAAEARKKEAERVYATPENVRQRATVAQHLSGERGRRASEFLGS